MRIRSRSYPVGNVASRKKALIGLFGGKCLDCGFSDLDRPEVFQFDHLPQFKKEKNISVMLPTHRWEAILNEAAKCELVCANCHATRTKNRRVDK